MNITFKKILLPTVISALLLACGDGDAGHAQENEKQYSLPFIVVDLDGDGIELIPLEESDVYFDVDGDGKKEHTGWMIKEDRLLLSMTIREDINLTDLSERMWKISTGGFAEILESDADKDDDYDGEDADYLTSHSRPFLRMGIASYDNNTRLKSEGPMHKICSFKKLRFLSKLDENISGNKITAEGELICEQGTFPVKEVRFQYSDKQEQ